MKKAVIFDLDGTLVNSLPDISGAMNRTLAAMGMPVHPEEAYKYMVGNGAEKLAQRAAAGHPEMAQTVLERYREDYQEHSRVNSHAYPGIREMLEKLTARGVKIAVFSNKDQKDTENVAAYYFPRIAFSAIRGKVADVPLKPDPAGALLCARAMGVSPDECLYVGDTNVDMQCGNAAGMETVGVLWGFRTQQELLSGGARHLIVSPDELPSLL
ncbi:MAG: HAD family hydrolase [Clostridiales bacterium]|nr:HAD family hydrolase [Clostridiales bacterium]